MKRTLQLILIIVCPLFTFSKGFIVKGTIEGLQTGSVTLAYVNEAGEDTTLTATIAGGTFTFADRVPEPELATLTVTGGWSYNIRFFLENSAIGINLEKDAPEKTSITGSANELIYEKLKPGLNTFFANARANEAVHHQAANMADRHYIKSADSLWTVQQHQWIQNIRSTIPANGENYAALHFIRWLLFRPDNYDTILSVFMQLSPAVRKGETAKKLLSDFEHMHRSAPGQPAPEITGKDTSGQSPKLSALKGKVVLLDFWASYCGPCRQENHNMLPVYQKYHPAGFEIVSLSLDNERSMWVKAIEADGMIWPQVSELRGGAGATGGIYEISDLPRNVLIDRTGKIYAKDLHGEELLAALEVLLGKRKVGFWY